jgi:hypothetical protein
MTAQCELCHPAAVAQLAQRITGWGVNVYKTTSESPATIDQEAPTDQGAGGFEIANASLDRIPAGERDADLHEVSGHGRVWGSPPGNIIQRRPRGIACAVRKTAATRKRSRVAGAARTTAAGLQASPLMPGLGATCRTNSMPTATTSDDVSADRRGR